MNAIEHAVALPPDEVVVHRATRRKILRNIAPLTTGAQDVHQAVHHRTHVGAALAAARPRRRNERRNNRPLLVREVAWVPQMITIVSRSVFLRPHRQPPANQTAPFQSQMIPVTPEVSRRTLRNTKGPLHWLAAFFVVAGSALAADQAGSQLALAQFTQQGPKLVGTGAVGPAEQGSSVALSADGNTAIVGGLDDNGLTGAAWVYTRSGGVWTQQGSKLVGTGAVGNAVDKASPSRCPPTATPPSWAGLTTTRTPGRRGSSPAAAASGPSRAASWSAPARLEAPHQGVSVALSADGNTAIVGGPDDNGEHRGGVGLHPQRRRLDPARQQAGRHRRGWNRRPRHLRRAVRRRQHRHRGRA